MGDPTLSTVTSMKAVDEWIAAINGNVSGAGRTGYKASKVTFGGGTAQVIRVPDSTKLPVQTPGESLSIAQTTLDLSQGVITASTEDTHLAISGPGFFVLTDSLSPDTAAGISNGNLYYTRDGEFTLDALGRYVNAQGLFLVSATDIDLNNDGDTNDTVGGLPEIAANKVITSTNIATYLANASSSLNERTLAQFVNPQALKFSQYGATIFEIGAAVAPTSGTFTSTIQTKALEASNSSLQLLVPELSLAQKMFQALTKVLQVHHTNIDSLINVIR